MTTKLRSWRATLDGRVLGTFEAPVGKAWEVMARRWPTPVASGRVVMERDPDDLALEQRREAARG